MFLDFSGSIDFVRECFAAKWQNASPENGSTKKAGDQPAFCTYRLNY